MKIKIVDQHLQDYRRAIIFPRSDYLGVRIKNTSKRRNLIENILSY